MDNSNPNQRHHPRVKKPLIIRFRDLALGAQWEGAQTLNVSKSGLCFITSKQYSKDTALEIRMNNPLLQIETDFTCKVVRSAPSTKIKIFFETAVILVDMNEEARNEYDKIIEIALQREQQ